MRKYVSRGPEDTREIGYRIGSLLKPGDIVGLYGELGAGKTTMVKGIAGALGIMDREIMSASYMIISEYASEPPFIHVDLYRIESFDEAEDIGFWEQIGGHGISVIEWAEKLEGLLPDDTIRVSIVAAGETERDITVYGIDEKHRNNR
jgi:tRNA threonylcarbamoyladenosine biosynthesis protein TsaE